MGVNVQIPLKELGMVMEYIEDIRMPFPIRDEMVKFGHSHGYNDRITEEENLVLVVDLEKAARILFDYIYPKFEQDLWDTRKEAFIDGAKVIATQLPNFCKITKGKL